jgi:hypothetical protein
VLNNQRTPGVHGRLRRETLHDSAESPRFLRFKKNRLQIAYPPGEWSQRIFGPKKVLAFPSKNGVPEWRSLRNFTCRNTWCIKKRFLRKRTRIDLFVFSIQEKGTDRTLPPCSRKRRTDRIQEDVCPTGFSCFLMNQENSYRPDSVCVQKQFCPTSLTPLEHFPRNRPIPGTNSVQYFLSLSPCSRPRRPSLGLIPWWHRDRFSRMFLERS